MVWYEYLITFDKEVDYFWRRTTNGASILFFASRYLTLVNAVYWFPWWNFSMKYEVCSSSEVRYESRAYKTARCTSTKIL